MSQVLNLVPVEGQDIPDLRSADMMKADSVKKTSAEETMVAWLHGEWIMASFLSQGSFAPGLGVAVGRKIGDVPAWHEHSVVLHRLEVYHAGGYGEYNYSLDMRRDNFLFKQAADFYILSDVSLSLHFKYAQSPEEDAFLQEMQEKMQGAFSNELAGVYRRCIESFRDGRLHFFIEGYDETRSSYDRGFVIYHQR